ncbi:hypothetical protein BXY66_0471 [Shimia isoporae]|uniref:Sulfotransferase family protein n=1 Tax=Shimia isoporae TaxID=647720 RepID=A0A4R1NJR2_9RHOB|nr:sulfotransferase [Shimia isoporae]TCL08434.1 hypothetical protein BXY66_0471 [Shimia isoporae]
MGSEPLLFQIGFNKCATSALFFLFLKSGYNALHSGGKFYKRKNGGLLKNINPQRMINDNITAGRAPLEGLERFHAFFDMEFKKRGLNIENFLHYKVFAEHYPHAKFLLNIRDKDKWLRSRIRHSDGFYLQSEMDRLGLTEKQTTEKWAAFFDRHIANVQSYFENDPDRLIVFNTDHDDIGKVISAVSPDFTLRRKRWGRVRQTDQVVEKKGWDDVGASTPLKIAA